MYVYAVVNLQRQWYTGVRHTKIKKNGISAESNKYIEALKDIIWQKR